MRTRTAELWVGLFMIAGIASLLMLALQVSGLTDVLKKETGYTVYAEFRNIGGLKVRAKVSLAGVVVGRVVNINLEPNSFNAKVEMFLDRHKLDKLPADSRASILTAGLLGDNYIGLQPGFEETNFLNEGGVISSQNTDSALQLEQLVSKFMTAQANKSRSSTDPNPKKANPAENSDAIKP